MTTPPKRLSTNEKLENFLNTTSIVDSAEADLIKKEEKARQKLRLSSLYSSGARFKVPHVKLTFCDHRESDSKESRDT